MVKNITNKFLEQLSNKLQSQSKTMTVTKKALEVLTSKAFKSKLGARGISKIINETIKQKLSYELLFREFINNNKVTIDFNEDFIFIFDNSIEYLKDINNKKIIFKTAQEAHTYDKNNPGTIITRARHGNGFIIKTN